MSDSERVSSQEQRLEAKLRELIAGGAWALGERLPAERRLAADLGASRNTLRGVLRRMEARGMVSIRKGSGCFLVAGEPRRQDACLAEEEPLAKLMARFEAAYLFLPEVVALAAQRMEPQHLARLEQCTTRLGRAIVLKDLDGIKEQTREFFQIVAAGTLNPVIGEIVAPFCASCSVMFPSFFTFSEAARSEMFADLVHILRFLQKQDGPAAVTAIRRKIVNTAVAFSTLKDIPLSPVLSKARAALKPG